MTPGTRVELEGEIPLSLQKTERYHRTLRSPSQNGVLVVEDHCKETESKGHHILLYNVPTFLRIEVHCYSINESTQLVSRAVAKLLKRKRKVKQYGVLMYYVTWDS